MTKKSDKFPVPKGYLVVIGGKENKGEDESNGKKKPGDFFRLEVLRAFKDLIKSKKPVLEVITTASSEANDTFKDYQKVFRELDFKTIQHIHHDSREELLKDQLKDQLKERIQKADGIFFTGGDQLKITSIYGGSDFLLQLKKRYLYEKFVIAGTSAGAMALSTPMIYAGNESVQELGGDIAVTTGLEFMKDVCIDTHFVHRGRFVRMAQVVATNPTCIGIGIEEDTGLIISNGTNVEVIGNGSVIIIEGFKITELDLSAFQKERPISVRNLNVHILSDRDKYEIKIINLAHKQ